ncbi:sensor histidine kinase [Actinomyces culturomici]|uniref:sensor histidine kinase n=1 Tax=Actinomyces culturomici TaxID=1926276 RepID=UPI000E1FB701|nr:histidine kinase [Actinomyces culturomici]
MTSPSPGPEAPASSSPTRASSLVSSDSSSESSPVREGAAARSLARVRAACSGLVRPTWADAAAALLLAYVSVWNAPDSSGRADALFGHGTPSGASGLFDGLIVACAFATLARRTLPLASVSVIGVACLVHVLAFDSLSLLVVGAGLVAMETATSRLRRPWSWAVVSVGGVGAAVSILLISREASGGTMEPVRAAALVSVTSAFVAAAALTGLVRRRGRERREQVVERLRIMNAQQEAERRLAVARERTRIARDVHDLLGHSLSVIGMQAEGARAVLAADPKAADSALSVIAQTSRGAIDEVRRLVDVLRADGEDAEAGAGSRDGAGSPDTAGSRAGSEHGAATPPEPDDADARSAAPASSVATGLDAIPALASRVRASGADLHLFFTASARVPEALGDCAYWTVQEALTNAIRHAPGTRIDVRVDSGERGLSVRIDNAPPWSRPTRGSSSPTVDAAAAPRPATSTGDAGRRGVGLVAMRERAQAVGAELAAGPSDQGGWSVVLTCDFVWEGR